MSDELANYEDAQRFAGRVVLVGLVCLMLAHESPANPELERFVDIMHIWLCGYASGKLQSKSMSGPEATHVTAELGRQCHDAPSKGLAEVAIRALRSVREGT